jgi:MFS family permease
MLSKWFYRKRGMVLSLATAGASAGGLILTPFASFLILSSHWRVAWIALGAFVLLLALPIVLIIMRDTPEQVGEVPDGGEGDDTAGATRRSGPRQAAPGQRTPLETAVWQDSLRSPPFWQLSGAYFVCGVTTIIISAHYVPFAIDLGISPGIAALAFGFMQGLNVVGVIVVGFLSDRFSRKNLLGTIYFIRFLAYVMLVTPGFMMMLWGFTIPPSIAIWSFAVLAGMSWIATPPLTSSLTADIYGVRNIGTLNGLSTMSHQIGGSLSVFMAGVLYDMTGAYEFPFAIAGLFLLGATVASYAVNERKFSIRYQSQPAVAASGEAG